MTRQATLVATLSKKAAVEVGSLPAEVGFVEVRADLVGDLDPQGLRQSLSARPSAPGGRDVGLLYTLRSRAEGGRFRGSEDERRDRLARAAENYDLVDLEADSDLTPGTLGVVPPARRLISWHGLAPRLPDLKARFEVMSAEPAKLYKLVPFARRSGDELAPIQLLRSLGRDDVIAFAGGDQGTWTRLIAPRIGAPWVYGTAGASAVAPGQPSVERLIRDFGLPDLPPVEALYGIVGNPVGQSLSPRLHNGAYRELGLPALYLPFQAESFADFWLEVVESAIFGTLGIPLVALSVTSPFKASALAVAGATSPLAECIDAANTLVLKAPVWEAESTDPEGVVRPLAERGVETEGAQAAVFGCGGAGRAAAVGLARAGAIVTLVNRGEERGRKAAEALCLPFLSSRKVDPSRFSILVNATPLGSGKGDLLPFDPTVAAGEAGGMGRAVVDLVYLRQGPHGHRSTPLIAAAEKAGFVAIGGREVLLGQALAQFKLMTGRELPLARARRLLGLDSSREEADADSAFVPEGGR